MIALISTDAALQIFASFGLFCFIVAYIAHTQRPLPERRPIRKQVDSREMADELRSLGGRFH